MLEALDPGGGKLQARRGRHFDASLPHTPLSFPSFPQASVKVTNEAPAGVRASLRATYASLSQDALDAGGGRAEWRPLLFASAFLHALVVERRRYGAAGYNVPYDFGRDDLAAVQAYLRRHVGGLDARVKGGGGGAVAGVNWDEVRYMVACIQYGGRITDDDDQVRGKKGWGAGSERCPNNPRDG